MATSMVEVDEEEPPLPYNDNDTDNDNRGDDEDRTGGISLGDHWNYYLLLIVSAFALLLGQRMASGCDFIRRTPHTFSQDGSNATTNYCQDTDQHYVNFTTTLETGQDVEGNSFLCDAFFQQHEYGFRMWSGQFFQAYTDGVEDQACFSYDMYIPRLGWITTPSFDGYFKASEFFSILANICGSIPFFVMIFMLCFPVPVVIRGCRRQQDETDDGVEEAGIMSILRWFFLAAWVSQCLTFLIFASNLCSVGFFFESLPNYTENYSGQHSQNLMTMPTVVDKVECSLGIGGEMGVAAAVLYFICFCMAPVAIPPPPVTWSYRHRRQQQQELEGEQTRRPSQPALFPTNATCSPRDRRHHHHHQGEYKGGNRVVDFSC